MLLLDEAFYQAATLCYGDVELHAYEAVSLLESMVEPEALLQALDQESIAQDLQHSVLRVNLQDVQLFCDQMQQYAHSSGFLHSDACIALPSAELALKRLVLLAEETWSAVRPLLLAACTARGTPSKFVQTDVESIVVATAAVEPGRFLGAFPRGTGEAFLSAPTCSLRTALGLSSSVFLLRIRLYQKLLRLLEAWAGGNSLAVHAYTGLQAWGLVDVSTTYRLTPQCVEVGSFPRLLLAVAMLDRVLGLGLGVEVLTTLCAYLAGQTGLLLPADSTAAATWHNVNTAAVTSKCGWVELGVLPMPDDTLQLLLESSLVQRKQHGHVCILMPYECMRALHEDATGDGDMVTAASVKVGIDVRIDPLASLQAACQRFDWWDRPSEAFLKAMGGKKGQVVSIGDAYGKHRVGVCVIGADKQPLTDALPIECLTVILPEPAQRGKARNYTSGEEESGITEDSNNETRRRRKQQQRLQQRQAALPLTSIKKRLDKKVPKKGRRSGSKDASSSTDETNNSTLSTTSAMRAVEAGTATDAVDGELQYPMEAGADELRDRLELESLGSRDGRTPPHQQLTPPQRSPRIPKRCKCNLFMFYGACPHVTGEEIPAQETVLQSTSTSAEPKEAEPEEKSDSIPIPPILVRVIDSTTNISVATAGTERKASPIALEAALQTRQVHFAGTPVKNSAFAVRFAGAKIAGTVIPDVSFSAYQWMQPRERRGLADVLRIAEEERNAAAAAAAAAIPPDLDNPLAFLAVDGKAYESFAVHRLQGRAVGPAGRPASGNQCNGGGSGSRSSSKVSIHNVALTAQEQEKAADMAAEQQMLLEFTMRAHNESESELNLMQHMPDAMADPLALALNDSPDGSAAQTGAGIGAAGKVAGGAGNAEDKQTEHENTVPDTMLRVSTVETFPPLELAAPLPKATSYIQLTANPKPLVFWQRAAWDALANEEPGTFHAVIRNSRLKEHQAAQLEQKKIADAVIKASLAKGRSVLRASSAISAAYVPDTELAASFSQTGVVYGSNIGKHFVLRDDTHVYAQNVREEAAQQRLVADDESVTKGMAIKIMTGTGSVIEPAPRGQSHLDRSGAYVIQSPVQSLELPIHLSRSQNMLPPADSSSNMIVTDSVESPVGAIALPGSSAGAGEDEGHADAARLAKEVMASSSLRKSPNARDLQGERDIAMHLPLDEDASRNLEMALTKSKSDMYLQIIEDVINTVPPVDVKAMAMMDGVTRANDFIAHQQQPYKQSKQQQEWEQWRDEMTARFPPKSVWSQDQPAPSPYPPQFPPRQPYVQGIYVDHILKERPRSGLPASQLFKRAPAVPPVVEVHKSLSAAMLIPPEGVEVPARPRSPKSPPKQFFKPANQPPPVHVLLPSQEERGVLGAGAGVEPIIYHAVADEIKANGLTATTIPTLPPVGRHAVQLRIPGLPIEEVFDDSQVTMLFPFPSAHTNSNLIEPRVRSRSPDPKQPRQVLYRKKKNAITVESGALKSVLPNLTRDESELEDQCNVPILVQAPLPLYQLRENARLDYERRTVVENSFNFAPLVDYLIDKRDEKKDMHSQENILLENLTHSARDCAGSPVTSWL